MQLREVRNLRRYRLEEKMFVFLAVLSLCARGTGQAVNGFSLPDSPGMIAKAAEFQQASPANLSGTVVVAGHGPARLAQVTLVTDDGKPERVVETDDAGHFVFAGLAPGIVKVTVSAPGLETFVSEDMTLKHGQTLEMPEISLNISTVSSSVQVVVTEEQLATEQVKAQEQQRVFGVLPNFYTSYLWEAAPMTSKLKFELAVRSRLDPIELVTTAITAGIQQGANTYPGYGDDAASYGKRYGAALADTVSERILGGALLPALLHQDPRYFRKGSGSKKSRVGYAIASAFLCRGDNGNRQVNYSYIVGNMMAAGLSNAYRADEDRKVSSTLLNVLVIMGGHTANEVIREFALKQITTNVPKYASVKP